MASVIRGRPPKNVLFLPCVRYCYTFHPQQSNGKQWNRNGDSCVAKSLYVIDSSNNSEYNGGNKGVIT